MINGNSVWLISQFRFLPIVSHTRVPQARLFNKPLTADIDELLAGFY